MAATEASKFSHYRDSLLLYYLALFLPSKYFWTVSKFLFKDEKNQTTSLRFNHIFRTKKSKR